MRKITQLRVLENYRLALTFDDGVEGIVDLANYVGSGVFAAWNDVDFFGAVRIGDCGELVWGEEIDLCPDALYLKMTGLRPEDLFPALKREDVHA